MYSSFICVVCMLYWNIGNICIYIVCDIRNICYIILINLFSYVIKQYVISRINFKMVIGNVYQ